MDTEVDLTTADHGVLIAIIAQLQATVLEQQRVIERLQRRIAELEGQAKPGDPLRMPGLKAKSARKPPAQQGPRKQRRHGFARPRMTPTHRVEHVVERCPDCGAHLSGGWTQRTREVIELPVVPVQVTEHVYIARTCPACRRRCTPPAVLDGVVLGQQRFGLNLLSLIATLREEGRLPIRSVQWYLDTVHQLRLSVGAIVSAIHRTAQRAQPAVAAILDRIRASQWSTPTKPAGVSTGPTATCGLSAPPPNATSCERYFLRRGRGKTVVDEALGESFSGVLVSDFYAAYHHYDGPKQRCWAHLLRDIPTSAPATPKTPHWPDGPRQSTSSMSQPKPATITSHGKGALPNWPVSASCWPSAALSCLTHRLSRASCAGASSATSRNSSSSWPNPQCPQTTTRPSAACAIWSSAARSEGAPGRNVVPRAR